MKLIQLNVWWGGKLYSDVASFFQKQRPDIICLNEACSAGNDSPTGMFLSTEEMQNYTKLPYATFAPLVSIRFMHRFVSMGNAIISRQPIVESDFFYTYLDHNKDFDWAKHDYNVRNLLHSTIEHNGKNMHVLTHHGYHVPDHKNGDEESLRQMKEIARYIDKLDGPVILTGDFNLAPHSKSLEVINDKLENLSIKHGLKTTRTSLTRKKEVCDYIFVNEFVKVKDFFAAKEVVSDHQALVLEFDL